MKAHFIVRHPDRSATRLCDGSSHDSRTAPHRTDEYDVCKACDEKRPEVAPGTDLGIGVRMTLEK